MNTGFPEAGSLQAHRCALFAAASRASNRLIRGHSSEEDCRRETDHLSPPPAPARKHPDSASADRCSRANELRALAFHCAAIDSRRSRRSIEDPLAARATNFRSEYLGADCNHRITRPGPDRSAQLLHPAERAARQSTSERSTMSQWVLPEIQRFSEERAQTRSGRALPLHAARLKGRRSLRHRLARRPRSSRHSLPYRPATARLVRSLMPAAGPSQDRRLGVLRLERR